MADGFPESQYGLILPTAVCGDVVVAGSLVSDGEPRGPSGDVRASTRVLARCFGASTQYRIRENPVMKLGRSALGKTAQE